MPADFARNCTRSSESVRLTGRRLEQQFGFVNEKPHKVAKDVTKKLAEKKDVSAMSGVRYVDDVTFRKAADKVFAVHHELLRRLAQ